MPSAPNTSGNTRVSPPPNTPMFLVDIHPSTATSPLAKQAASLVQPSCDAPLPSCSALGDTAAAPAADAPAPAARAAAAAGAAAALALYTAAGAKTVGLLRCCCAFWSAAILTLQNLSPLDSPGLPSGASSSAPPAAAATGLAAPAAPAPAFPARALAPAAAAHTALTNSAAAAPVAGPACPSAIGAAAIICMVLPAFLRV